MKLPTIKELCHIHPYKFALLIGALFNNIHVYFRGYDEFYGPPVPPGRMMPPGRGMRRAMPPPPRYG
jgi:hypothetical protein